MAPREERIKIQNKLMTLLPEVREDLMKIQGVFDVGVGLKIANRELTDEIVFQVFVDSKIDEQELHPDSIIPKKIKGIKTDVQTVHHGAIKRGFFDPGLKGDERKYERLKAGIMVGYGIGGGTLGCFARLKDNSLVLLTNHHVIAEDREPDALVGQPQYNRRCCCCCGYDENRIGVLLKKGVRDSKVDAALAKIDPAFEHDVIIENAKSLERGQSLRIEGTANVLVSGDTVFKIGQLSGFTKGVIVTVTGKIPEGEVWKEEMVNQIFIHPHKDETFHEQDKGKRAFSDKGDSGSVILNEKNQIIGLLHGGNPNVENLDVDVTYASHIKDVLDALKADGLEITIENSPPKSAARKTPEGKIVDKPVRADQALKEKLLEYAQGKLWLNIFEKHHKEILDLVNHDRQVTVTWQRNQGPAYIAHVIKSAQDPLYIIPPSIETISLQQLMIKMVAILKVKGSRSLQDDIDKYGITLIDYSSGLNAVSELFNKLNEKPAELDRH